MNHPLSREFCRPETGQRFVLDGTTYELRGKIGDGAAGLVRKAKGLSLWTELKFSDWRWSFVFGCIQKIEAVALEEDKVSSLRVERLAAANTNIDRLVKNAKHIPRPKIGPSVLDKDAFEKGKALGARRSLDQLKLTGQEHDEAGNEDLQLKRQQDEVAK